MTNSGQKVKQQTSTNTTLKPGANTQETDLQSVKPAITKVPGSQSAHVTG